FTTVSSAPNTHKMSALAEQVASGALRVPVTATYPLEQAPQAFAAFGAGALGKLAVTCS
ncbi:zinc-binding dehydrogenase, partial [Streptomyces sp. NPDC057456]|uniref:zinc-binding dehydrogenase n=1 Tax=Streptomyces sp. NPDC057456 TaxID=3346139 RepID=UPI0036B03C72